MTRSPQQLCTDLSNKLYSALPHEKPTHHHKRGCRAVMKITRTAVRLAASVALAGAVAAATPIIIRPPLPTDGGVWIDASNRNVEDGITPADVEQGRFANCYADVDLEWLAYRKSGIAKIREILRPSGQPNEWICTFTLNGVVSDIYVNCLISQDDNPIAANPLNLIWDDLIRKAWAFWRTGMNTFASTEWGNPRVFAFSIDLDYNVPQPRNVAECRAMNKGDKFLVSMTTGGSVPGTMVASHAYAMTPEEQQPADESTMEICQPWPASTGKPRTVIISDFDVGSYGFVLGANAGPAPVAVITPPVTIPPVQPQEPTVPISKPSKPNVNVKSYGTEVSWDSGDPACTLYRAFDVTMVNAVVIGNFKAGQSSCIDAIPTVPVFYVLKNVAGVFGAVTGPVDPPNMPTTVPPVTITAVGPIAAELSAHGLTLFAADFAAKYPGK